MQFDQMLKFGASRTIPFTEQAKSGIRDYTHGLC